ncbi:MAG: helix-turn-helix domain-containing protein [Erysipelotrichaceae bacterium]|nr:helix-turn-helix domain-containing protein [Erysipelotrichaceae bacterium]
MKTDGKAALNKLKKRTSLMEAAFELFTEEGFQNTTISEIARKAGIGKGTFYFYFEDKYDIRNRIIISKSYEILHEALSSIPDKNDTFENKVIYVADRIIEKLSEDRILLRFIHKNLSWALLENSAEMSETFDLILKQAEESKEHFYKDVKTMMYLIIEMINGACYTAILYESPLPLEELKPKLFDSVRAVMKAFEVTKA